MIIQGIGVERIKPLPHHVLYEPSGKICGGPDKVLTDLSVKVTYQGDGDRDPRSLREA